VVKTPAWAQLLAEAPLLQIEDVAVSGFSEE